MTDSSVALDWEYLSSRTAYAHKEFIFRLCVELTRHLPGNVMEFGVFEGHSTRLLRRALGRSQKRIFACDSFQGLPEKYEGADVGTFACQPPKIRGVEIVKGYFENSLTAELAARVKHVAFASLDADLYSSTLCVLRWLTPLLGTGSLLLFDEFLGERESEKRAFEEWSQESGIKTVKIAEFMRVPAAWGKMIDSRPIFQVVGIEPIPHPNPPLKYRLLTSPPANFARKVRNGIRGHA